MLINYGRYNPTSAPQPVKRCGALAAKDRTMQQTTKDVFEAIAGLTRLSTDVMPLAAIWLEKPLQTARKRTSRITKGDLVRVMNMGDECHLMDCTDLLGPTHLILECRGTIYSGDLQVICEDLDTQELITIKL